MEKVNEIDSSLYEKIVKSCKAINLSKIKFLKIILKYIIDTQCDINSELCKLSTEIREDLVNSLIMAYIEIWMENDESNKQSIESYFKNISQMQSQIKNSEIYDLLDTVRRELYIGKKLIRDNFSLQNEYSEQKNLKYKKLSPKLSYGNKYSLLELEEFYKIAVEPLSIYIDIFKNDIPYHTKNRTFKSVSINIAQRDIDEYRLYLNHIKSLINENNGYKENGENKITKNNKEFVVKCLFVWKHERTYRYRQTATYAKFLSDKKISNVNKIYIPNAIKYYYSPYSIPLWDDKIKICNSYFIKSYDSIISAGYSDKNSNLQRKIMVARACFEICLDVICKNFRSNTLLGSWSDNDFDDVARFMIDEYRIRECLEMPDITDKNVYTNFKKLFQNPNYINSNQIAYYKEKHK